MKIEPDEINIVCGKGVIAPNDITFSYECNNGLNEVCRIKGDGRFIVLSRTYKNIGEYVKEKEGI